MIAFGQLTWLYGKPQNSGLLRTNPEGFLVMENLDFTPSDKDEHVLVRILKNGYSARFVTDALAKFLRIHTQGASFAGQGDKYTITEQQLCARVPSKEMPDLSKFQLEGCQVSEYAHHKRKLRLDTLKGNRLTVILCEISNRQGVETRLRVTAEWGVSNYFGAQHSGIGGSNPQDVLRWAENDAPVCDYNKRNFWLSTTHNALSNQRISIRLRKAEPNQAVDGDTLRLTECGSRSVVVPEEPETPQAQVYNHELMTTTTLPGSDDQGSQHGAPVAERATIAEETPLQALLIREKVETARQTVLPCPQQLNQNWWDNITVELRSWLLADNFIINVVRELVNATGDYANIAE